MQAWTQSTQNKAARGTLAFFLWDLASGGIYDQPMTNLASDLRNAAIALETVSETPRLDAELLLAHALGVGRSEMLLRQHGLTTPHNFPALLARRMAHEPVAYIIGHQAFWDLDLHVTPDVLIPRADSETVLEAAIDWFDGKTAPARIADLGTGSGALLLAGLSIFPDATGTGVDASPAAIEVAKRNASSLGMDDRASFQTRDWRARGWTEGLGTFDLILCNPPYIENEAVLSVMVAQFEPHAALFAGPDGLNDYRALVPVLASILSPNGVVFFEIGYNQAESVATLGRKAGFSTNLRHDLSGNPRVLRFSLGIEDLND